VIAHHARFQSGRASRALGGNFLPLEPLFIRRRKDGRGKDTHRRPIFFLGDEACVRGCGLWGVVVLSLF